MGKLPDIMTTIVSIHDARPKKGFPLPISSASSTSVIAKSPPASNSQLRYDAYDLPKALRSSKLARASSWDDESTSQFAVPTSPSTADFAALDADSRLLSDGDVRLQVSAEFEAILMDLADRSVATFDGQLGRSIHYRRDGSVATAMSEYLRAEPVKITSVGWGTRTNSSLAADDLVGIRTEVIRKRKWPEDLLGITTVCHLHSSSLDYCIRSSVVVR